MAEDPPASAIFADRGAAARAAEELLRAGFADDDIGFAMLQRTGMGVLAPPSGAVPTDGEQGERTTDTTSAAGGSSTVAVLTGLLGEAAAGLAPGVGPIFAGGILAGLVRGTPGSTSGIAAGLLAVGMTAEEAEWCERAIEAGNVLVTVRSPARGRDAAATLVAAGGSAFPGDQASEHLPEEGTRR